MIHLSLCRDKKILVVGLGQSGLASARALRSSGALPYVWDDNETQRAVAVGEGFKIYESQLENMSSFDAVLWSPGIPHRFPTPHPLAIEASESGHILRCDVDFLYTQKCKSDFICISGTNGKSTTTSLISHILGASGRPVAVGGNLGFNALELDSLEENGIYVIEISSFQTELSPNLSCDVSVLLNITPDHLERHGGLDGYVEAKAKLIDRQIDGALTIISEDDEYCLRIKERICQEKNLSLLTISTRKEVSRGVSVLDGIMRDNFSNQKDEINLNEFRNLQGKHNWQNIAASYAVGRHYKIESEVIINAISSFRGLLHRQEFVKAYSGVTFINDSKATNWAASLEALNCYNSIYWIAGGKYKFDFPESIGPVSRKIKKAFLIGESADELSRLLVREEVPFFKCESLEEAIIKAGRLALSENFPDSTVLLSPACSSYDMFESFEDRGNIFRELVNKNW